MNHIEIRQLKNNNEIEQAGALLYEVYCAKNTWKFGQNNPSMLHIEVKNGEKLLIDRFTHNAVWFGAFDKNVIVGCARLCGVDENGKFEIQGYPSSEVIDKYLTKSSIEAGRVAVNIMYRGKKYKLLERIYLSLIQYAYDHGLDIFGCASNIFVQALFNRINLPLLEKNAFKYEESDDSLVDFYMINHKNNGEYEHIINKLKEFIDTDQKKYDILDTLPNIVSMFPVPIYWMDGDGVVLGVNGACLKGMGATRIDDIIGKTPYDFYPKPIADTIISHNMRVMQSGETLSQEEEFIYFGTKKIGYAKALKSPLYDNEGNLIGVLGISIDITAEKEAEQLKIQNAVYQEQLKSNELMKECFKDIQSAMHIVQRKLDGNSKEFDPLLTKTIKLTKREQEILYYLSINKEPKAIANILANKEGKKLSPATISSIINKHLYPKFEAFSIGELIEKATLMNLIPFLLD